MLIGRLEFVAYGVVHPFDLRPPSDNDELQFLPSKGMRSGTPDVRAEHNFVRSCVPYPSCKLFVSLVEEHWCTLHRLSPSRCHR